MLRTRSSARTALLGVALLAAAIPLAGALSRSRSRAVRGVKAFFLGATLLADDGVELQRGAGDCGPAALRRIFALRERALAVDAVASLDSGWTPAQIVAASRNAGLDAHVVRTPPAGIGALPLPAIALLGTHYVVIERQGPDGRFTLYDPDLGRLTSGSSYLTRNWRGYVVAFPLSNAPLRLNDTPRSAGTNVRQGGT